MMHSYYTRQMLNTAIHPCIPYPYIHASLIRHAKAYILVSLSKLLIALFFDVLLDESVSFSQFASQLDDSRVCTAQQGSQSGITLLKHLPL
jgi:hypothetical protein